jgi:hypothetical protein
MHGHNPKLRARSIECVLISYAPQAKAYRCWECSSGKIYNSIDVCFIEANETVRVKLKKDLLAARPSEPTILDPTVPDDQSSDDPPLTTSVPPPDAILVPPPPIPSVPEPTVPALCRSERTHRPPARTVALACPVDGEYDGEQSILDAWDETVAAMPEDNDGEEAALLADLNAYLCENPIDVEYPDDPNTYTEAMASLDADKWIEGMHKELAALRDKEVYKLVPPSAVLPNKTILDLRAVYTRKRDMDGNVVHNKVRYCVKGFRQVYGRDFTTTTSPTARLESFRAVLHVAATHNWDVQQVDIKTAFLNARLPDDEVQYTRQPKHFEEKGKEGWMWMLLRSLYGLKQSGRI